LKKLFSISLLLLLANICLGAKWERYDNSEGKYGISLPGKPITGEQRQKATFGELVWHTWTVANADAAYQIKYTDLPTGTGSSDSLGQVQGIMFFSVQDLVQALGPKALDSMQMIQYKGYPGRDYLWTDKKTGQKIHRHVYLVHSRIYCAEIKFPSTKKPFESEKFFAGLQIDVQENTSAEKVQERPVKDFVMVYPGNPTSHNEPFFDNYLGNIFAVTEAYSIPNNQRALPDVKNTVYGINYSVLPNEKMSSDSLQLVKNFLHRALNENVQHNNGTLLWVKDINVNGYYGIEAEYTFMRQVGVLHVKRFLIKNHFYQIVVLSKYGMQDNVEAENFINSFKLL
jgi:hypothetical protein